MFGITGERGVSMMAQVGSFVGAITVCILCGLYMQFEYGLDNFADANYLSQGNCLIWEGYGNTGLTIATIILCGIAVFLQLFCLMITFFKKEEMIMVQLVLTGLSTSCVGIGSILIGALLGTTITKNKNSPIL